ncbi:MAG: 4Fe-4S binding protein [Deltaproteobacteria bacterium]|nr:4Fe-4S binding protein [Deltaproteobacteria bacterium]
MPWVNNEMCTGCGTCIDECYVGAISMEDDIAFLDEDNCIRCGVCHDVCPEDAVRHDGERIPEEVESNLARIRRFLEHDYYAGDKKRQRQLIERMKRYFTKERQVAEKTIERIDILQDMGCANPTDAKNNNAII